MAQFTKADRDTAVASVAGGRTRSGPAGLTDLQRRADASAAVDQLSRWTNRTPVQRRATATAPEEAEQGSSATGLPAGLQSGIEQLSGMSLDDVQVHRNSPDPARLGAHAYAQGRDIHMAPGQEQHLPHEAWHVVQQMQGRVRPTHQMKGSGVAINDDAGLEREADVMGARAASFSDRKEPAKDA